MTAHVLSVSWEVSPQWYIEEWTHLTDTVFQQPLPPVTFANVTQHKRDVQVQNNALTIYNMSSGALEMYAGNAWVPFVHASTTPAYGDSLAYDSVTGLWNPSPTTNPTIDSLRIYGSSTTALEVKRVYSDTGGSHASSTGSMDAVGVHELTGSSNVTYTITIDSSGTQEWTNATFTWTDATTTVTTVPVYSGTMDGRKALAPIELSNGVYVLFTVGNYVNGETWTVTAIAADNQVGALSVTTAPTTGNAESKIRLRGATEYAAIGIDAQGLAPGAGFGRGIWLQYDGISSPAQIGMWAVDSNGVDAGTGLIYTLGGGRDDWYLGTTYDDPTLLPGIVLDHNATGAFSVRAAPIQLDEISTPSAAANRAKFYAKDKSAETIPYWRNSTAEYEIGLLGTTAAPIGADYLVGTTQSGLSGEIVVGTSPGGELGGTWASPTVDTTHSGSSHAGVVSTHEAAADPHTGYVLESLLDAKGDLISASAADTPIILTVGANDTILMADSSAASGLKWVASATPVAVGTTLATGTSDDFARASHVHVATTLVDSSGGTSRVVAASSSPHVSVTGDLDVSAHIGVGAAATVGTAQALLIQENPTQAADYKGVYVAGTLTMASSAAARSYIGYDNIFGASGAYAVGTFTAERNYYEWNVAATATTFTGIQNLLYVGSLFGSTTAAVATTFLGLDIRVTANPNTSTSSQTPVGTMKAGYFNLAHSATANAGQTATVTTAYGLHVDVDMATSAQQRMTTFTGIDIDLAGVTTGTVTTGYALRIQDFGAATVTTRWGLWQNGASNRNWLEGVTEIGAVTANTAPSGALSAQGQLTVSKSASAGSTAVFRVPATNDDPTIFLQQSRAATTDGTVTTLDSFSTATGYMYTVEVVVNARNTGGSTAGGYRRIGTFRNDGGTVTQVGTTTSVHTAEDTAGWDVTLDISGTNIRVRVTGAAATNITWHGHVWVSYHAS